MKSCILAFMAVLAIGLCEPRMIAAQVPSQGGMFGNRVLGQSLAPTPSTFGSGIQTTAGGSFLYIGRSNGATSFPMSSRQLFPGVAEQAVGFTPAAQPGLQLTVPSQLSTPGQQFASPSQTLVPDWQSASPAQSPAAGYDPLEPSAEQNAGMTLGTETAPAWSFSRAQQGGTRAASELAAHAGS